MLLHTSRGEEVPGVICASCYSGPPGALQLGEVQEAYIGCIITPKITSVLRLYSSNLLGMAIQAVISLTKGVGL